MEAHTGELHQSSDQMLTAAWRYMLNDPPRPELAKHEASLVIIKPESTNAELGTGWLIYAQASVLIARKEDSWFMWLEARGAYESAKDADVARSVEADLGIRLCDEKVEEIEKEREAELQDILLMDVRSSKSD